MSDSWYDDARITEAQLDAIRSDLGGNGRAQYSRAAMRKVMAEIDRLQGHLNAIAAAHEEGVLARRRLDEIRDQEKAELTQRAETAKRELARQREGSRDVAKRCMDAMERATTAERELAELRERIGEERVEWAIRTVPGAEAFCATREGALRNAADWTRIRNDGPWRAESRIVGEWKAAAQQPEDGDHD